MMQSIILTPEQTNKILTLENNCRKAQEIKDAVIETIMLAELTPQEVALAFQNGKVRLDGNNLIITE